MQTIRVLLVDDCATHLGLTTRLLTEAGDISVVGRATNGDEGIQLCRTLGPDVVVLDLSLPDISGWQVASTLRRELPATRLVVLSSHDTQEHRLQASRLAARFVSKLHAASDLIDAVRDAPGQVATIARLLSANAHDVHATLVVDRDGVIHHATEPATRVLRRHVVGRSLVDLVHADDASLVRDLLGEPNRARTGRHTLRVASADHVSWLETRWRRFAEIDPDLTVVSAWDVSDLKTAIADLAESEARFRDLTGAIEEVFWVTDVHKQHMFYVSPAYEAIWGRPRESLYRSPRSWLDAVHVADRARVEASLVLQATSRYDLEYRITRPDAEVRWIRDRAFPLVDADGSVYRIAGLASDVTERRQLQKRLEDQGILETIGRLAGSVAHDFNNMLSVIRAYTAEIAETAGGRVAEPIEAINEATDHAAALTRQLSAFARIHADRSSKATEPVDLGAAMTRLVRLSRRVLGRDILVRCQVGDGLPMALAAPCEIDQVVLNLLANARDAMPQGGRIDLATRLVERSAPDGATATPSPWLQLTVRDTGSGIAPDHVPRIFDAYFTTKANGQGTGLGLATVREIATRHGGWVEVDSQLGVGTEFRVYLPPLAAPSAEHHAAASGTT